MLCQRKSYSDCRQSAIGGLRSATRRPLANVFTTLLDCAKINAVCVASAYCVHHFNRSHDSRRSELTLHVTLALLRHLVIHRQFLFAHHVNLLQPSFLTDSHGIREAVEALRDALYKYTTTTTTTTTTTIRVMSCVLSNWTPIGPILK